MAAAKDLPVHVGNIFSSDSDDADFWDLWVEYGVLAAEMETAALLAVELRLIPRAQA